MHSHLVVTGDSWDDDVSISTAEAGHLFGNTFYLFSPLSLTAQHLNILLL
jgi:acyl-coenzyme A synthetase/AMP-(fatty) acid ligase